MKRDDRAGDAIHDPTGSGAQSALSGSVSLFAIVKPYKLNYTTVLVRSVKLTSADLDQIHNTPSTLDEFSTWWEANGPPRI